ncbi:rifin [Plasmodium reichenowi]|uniref:Rifin n=1 Tax=Plasmodium reichenowi TaxID=5854 RepID=A0A060RQS1_PLARE|nr:rifin [Plasmodium reichenowi]
MKLYCSKILLFFFQLSILVTSYHVHNKNKLYNTPHRAQTNRSLCECDTQSSIYNNDTDIKSVKENFNRQTSQRFEEYEERIKDKRQKRKEQRDKNIQKIIEKDKMEKSLTEKVEKGCLRCGCALGGGVLPVWGLVSGLRWCSTCLGSGQRFMVCDIVTTCYIAIQKGIEAGIKEGLVQIKNIYNLSRKGNVPQFTLKQMLSSGKFTNDVTLYDMFEHIGTMYDKLVTEGYNDFASYVSYITGDGSIIDFNTQNSTHIAAVARAFEDGKALEFAAKTGLLSNTIIASVVTIIIIVLIMVIIYLVLRYRRKKKMKKKAQYTKLLKE